VTRRTPANRLQPQHLPAHRPHCGRNGVPMLFSVGLVSIAANFAAIMSPPPIGVFTGPECTLDPDVVLAQFRGEGPGHPCHRMLTRGVVHIIRCAPAITVFQVPVTLTSMMSRNDSGVISFHGDGIQIPALATMMSSRP
jgi:hypothetical protein